MNNDLLIATSVIERAIRVYVKGEKRSQLTKIELAELASSIAIALSKIKTDNIHILGPLVDVNTLIEEMLRTESFTETDLETKEVIAQNLYDSLDLLYRECALYYQKNEFSYSVKLDTLLITIIEYCAKRGMRFELKEAN